MIYYLTLLSSVSSLITLSVKVSLPLEINIVLFVHLVTAVLNDLVTVLTGRGIE